MDLFKLFGKIAVDNSEANDALDDTGSKVDDVGVKVDSGMSKFAKWGGKIAAVAGAAAIALGGLAVSAADDMQTAVNSFASETGTAKEELGEYEDVLESIYANNYGESFEDIANAMSQVKQQAGDIGADELEEMTTNALMLRDTFDFEVNESMRAAKMLMDQFNISSEEAFNMIAQGAQNGLDKNGDLLDSINEYSVHYEQLGFTAEEFFDSLANGTEAGTFSVDKLGDAMKEFGIRSKDGSDTSREAFEMLGLDADEMFAVFNKGGDEAATATQTLIDKLTSMPDGVEKTTAGVALFGTMWEDLGAEGIKALGNLEGGIDTTVDALGQINEVKYDSLGSALEGIKRTLETTLLVPLGQKLIPVIETLLEKATPLLTPIMELVESILPVLVSLLDMLLPPAIEIIEMIMPVITDTLQMIMPPLMQIVSAVLPLLMSLIQALLPVLQPILSLLGPILDLVVAIIEPLTTILSVILPPIIKVIEVLVEVLATKLKIAIETVSNIITNVFGVAFDYIRNQVALAKDIFNNIIAFIKNVFTGNWKDAWENVKNIIGGIFEGMKNVVKTPINAIIGIINGLIKGAVSGINTLIGALNKIDIKIPDWVPAIGGQSIGFDFNELTAPQISYLAEGGIIDEPTYLGYYPKSGTELIGGEAGAEAITPIEKLKAYIREAVTENNGVVIDSINQRLDKLIELLSLYLPLLLNRKMVLDSGVLVGELLPDIDSGLGLILNNKERGN